MEIQGRRYWFASPFGPHVLVWLRDRLKGVPVGFADYRWNWRGQCVGVFSNAAGQANAARILGGVRREAIATVLGAEG